MSNSYYNFSPRFIPGTKVRAGAVNTQFDLLEDAFDLLPSTPASIPLGKATLGVESGSGNAYVVTMPNTRLANANGDEVVFKATHQNSGASTLQVDAISAAPLVRWDGSALSAGDILVDSYYAARYDATNIRFLVTWPAQSTVVGTITYAAPTGKAKLVASAGALSSVIRSDADIAIDQTIVPTWTGQHTFSSPILGPSGTALLPVWSFSGDPNTGSYSVGADDWGVTTGGTLRFDISTTAVTSTLPLLANAGSNTAPSHSFSGDSNTGSYSVGADDWGVATGGTLRFDISTTLITSTLSNVGPAGSSTAPTWSFSGDPNTGSYSVGADDWGVTTGGTLRFDISTTAVTSTLPLRIADGSVGTPAWSFSGDVDTGVYRRSSGDMGFTTNGVLSFVIAPTFSACNTVFFVADGTAALPSASFNNDPNTGAYSVGADNWGVSTGGTLRFDISTTAITSTLPFRTAAGSASAPAYSFSSGTNYGMYLSGGTALVLATAGAARLGVDVNAINATVPFTAANGAVGAPSYAFGADLDLGIYTPGSNTLSIVAGGGELASFSTVATNLGPAGSMAQFITTTNAIILGQNSSTTFRINGVTTGVAGAATGSLTVNINGVSRQINYT